ncbi:MAG: cupin domain-containing protein [Armatimonadota bacterium]
MPVINARELRDNPDASEHFSSFGVMQVPRGESVEPHFHDCDEWWIVTRGHALISTEGEEYEIQPGDMVYTPMGEDHAIKEVYRDLEGVYFEGPLQGRKRRGHLHHPDDD